MIQLYKIYVLLNKYYSCDFLRSFPLFDILSDIVLYIVFYSNNAIVTSNDNIIKIVIVYG